MLLKNLNNCYKLTYKFCTGPLKTVNPSKPIGKLTILPTPIGNLQDLSPNIIKALFKADIIGCEDRRVAGKLYTLIKNKNIMQTLAQQFGEIGLHSLIPHQNNTQNRQLSEEEENHKFYNYSNMNDKGRKKFLRKMTKQEQQKFKIDYLKYRALKIMKNQDQFLKKQKQDKYDQLYGLDSSDLQYIELQIKNTRIKKGRGVLIPLNTYSQTKMFNMVRMFLQTKNVAIISDAGMPCISDPGWKMVRKIRQNHPQIPIQVIGGPSSVSIMTLLASMSSKQNTNSLSGRFEGFAPQQVSNMTDKSIQIQSSKKQQFSIHFINGKKLRNKALQLQKVYGQDHNIFLANQLTKLYERKYHGTLRQLNSEMSKQNLQFEGIGQLSYLFYPERKQNKQVFTNENKSNKENSSLQIKNQLQQQKQEQRATSLPRLSLISIHNFIDSIKQSQNELKLQEPLKQGQISNNSTKQLDKKKIVTSKDLIQLICTVFGIKSSQARKIVYEKDIERRNKNKNLNKKPDLQQIYNNQRKQNQGQNPSTSTQKRGRRGGRNSTKTTQNQTNQQLTPEQQIFLKQLQKDGRNLF